MNTIQKFEFNDQLIDFEVENGNVKVNATQMAKAFKKNVEAFTRNESTEKFVEECLKSENSSFLNVKSSYDLIVSRQKSGTWMHSILALKFASWLHPRFELWVYSTVNQILFAYYLRLEESLKKSANIQKQIEELENKLTETPEYIELKRLEFEERQLKLQRAKENRNQLELFKSE